MTMRNYFSLHSMEQVEQYVKSQPEEIRRKIASDMLPQKADIINTTFFQKTVFKNFSESYFRHLRNKTADPPILLADRIINAYFAALREYTNKFMVNIDEVEPMDEAKYNQVPAISAQRRAKKTIDLDLNVGSSLFSRDFDVISDAVVIKVMEESVKVELSSGQLIEISFEDLKKMFILS